MDSYREVIESNLLSNVINLPESMKNIQVELIIKPVSNTRPNKKTPFIETNIKLNGYKFNRAEANAR